MISCGPHFCEITTPSRLTLINPLRDPNQFRQSGDLLGQPPRFVLQTLPTNVCSWGVNRTPCGHPSRYDAPDAPTGPETVGPRRARDFFDSIGPGTNVDVQG